MTLRALGGRSFAGADLSRVLYVDEAGIGNPVDEPFLVVAGLLVHGDTQLNKLYQEIEAVGQLMPEKCRKDGLILHPSHIYGGNGKFDERRYPEWSGKRMPILEALAQVPQKANIVVAFGVIRRSDFKYEGLDLSSLDKAGKHPKKYNKTVAAHALTYMACLLEADMWLRKFAKGENCMVIVEDNQEAKAAIKLVQRFHQDKHMPLTGDDWRHFPLRQIREDPAFQEKRPDHPLILADFAAFILKRAAMNDANALPLLRPWRDRMLSLRKVEQWRTK